MTPTDQRLQAVFREFFDDDSLQLRDGMTFSDIEGWDSLAHMNLINALEAEFGLKFSVRELMRMKSVGTIRQVLTAKASSHV
ncbi:MAG TPA: acyl carrier protein [Methylomirabilota bacterium]|nr:acyl carrier protein [Methylomirabilota bacterium]